MALTDLRKDSRTDVQRAADRIRELTAAVVSHTETASRQIKALVGKYGKTVIEAELGDSGAALTKTYDGMKTVVKEGSGRILAELTVSEK